MNQLLRGPILPYLPSHFDSGAEDEDEAVPNDLIGATIIGFGGIRTDQPLEDGGLAVDYKPAGSDAVRRVVFGFNELGMWVELLE